MAMLCMVAHSSDDCFIWPRTFSSVLLFLVFFLYFTNTYSPFLALNLLIILAPLVTVPGKNEKKI